MRASDILDSGWFENFMGWSVLAIIVLCFVGLVAIAVFMLWPSHSNRSRSVYRETDGRCYVLDSHYTGTRPALVGKVILQQPQYQNTRRYLSASACDEVAP